MRGDDWTRARTVGLNPTQLAILDLLAGRPTGLGVREIARQLGVSQPTTTDSINALERKALVAKRSAGADRRFVAVALSAAGRAVLAATGPAGHVAERASRRLDGSEAEDFLLLLVKMIRHLQLIDAIPIQRMCVTCRHFAPFAHPGAAQPHHCRLVDAPFGQRDLRIECREHETADPAARDETWDAFQAGPRDQGHRPDEERARS